MGILAASTVALPFTSGAASIMVVAALMGFGNGIGSGIQMTLAADVSTEPGRTKFLGLWRLVSDSGGAAGPAAASVIAGAASLAVAIMSLGGLGLLTTAWLAFLLRRYAPRRRAGAHHDSRQGSASPAEDQEGKHGPVAATDQVAPSPAVARGHATLLPGETTRLKASEA
jgi:hypothetical protein